MKLAQIDFNNLKIPTTGNAPINLNDQNLTIGTIISAFLPYIFAIAGILLLIYLIFGGLQLMTSQGEPKAVGAARQHITNALIGFVIIFFAFWAVRLTGLILRLNGIQQIFGGM